MINTDAACERNVQDAAGQSGYAIGDLFRIDFHSHIHRHECDGELLRRRLRRVLVDVRICATHKAYIVAPLLRDLQLLSDGICRRAIGQFPTLFPDQWNKAHRNGVVYVHAKGILLYHQLEHLIIIGGTHRDDHPSRQSKLVDERLRNECPTGSDHDSIKRSRLRPSEMTVSEIALNVLNSERSQARLSGLNE